MTDLRKLATTIIAAGLIGSGSLAAQAAPVKSTYENEVQTCITQVGEHADYDQARRVRHTVVLVEETRFRYKFTIQTAVFTDTGETAARSYDASCTVLANGTPLKFEIDAAG